MMEKSTHLLGNLCWKCSKDLLPNSRYCSFCGVDQSRQESYFDIAVARKKTREINPIKIISNLHSFQLLAVVGGLLSLVPILIATLNLGRIFEIIEFYFGLNLAGYDTVLMGFSYASIALCLLVMVLPFLIQNPKTVGKVLFFSSFGILGLSILTGTVGFVMILAAGILALKQRRY